MPIKTMTDRGVGFAEIGSIRKGAEKTENKPGKDLEYFRVEFSEGEDEAAEKFANHYKDEPKQLDILLPFNEIERCWDAWYEAYVSGAMIARADGEIYIYQRDQKTGDVLVQNGLDVHKGRPKLFNKEDVVATWTNKKDKEVPVTCKPVGRLRVILPVLQRLAFLTLHTTSIHDIINISQQLEGIRKINDGKLVGIPIVMKRVPKMISTPRKGGKRVRSKKWLVSLEADPSWVREKLQEMKIAALPGNGMALLPEPEVIEGELVGPENDPDAPVIRFTSATLEKVVNENLAPNMKVAEEWLNSSNLPLDADWETIERWLKAFSRGIDNNDGREDFATIAANKAYADAVNEELGS